LLEIYTKFMHEIEEGGFSEEDKIKIGLQERDIMIKYVKTIFKSYSAPNVVENGNSWIFNIQC